MTTDAPPAVEDGTQVVSFSELDTYRQCPFKHELAYKHRYSKPPVDGSPLRKGSLWHLVMEAHYKEIQQWQMNSGPRPFKQISLAQTKNVLVDCAKAVQPFLSDAKGEQSEDQALIQWMYEGHVEKYGIDRQWIILGVEERKQWALPDENGQPSNYIIKAKLDLTVMEVNTRLIWIIDHKSSANLPSQMDLEIDDQFGLYTWLMREEGIKVQGSIHNAARTTRNMADWPHHKDFATKRQTLDQRMHRTYLNRTDVELTSIALDAYNVSVNAYPEIVSREPLPLYSSPDARQCGWKCDFKEVHLMARTGIDLEQALESQGFVQNFERH